MGTNSIASQRERTGTALERMNNIFKHKPEVFKYTSEAGPAFSLTILAMSFRQAYATLAFDIVFEDPTDIADHMGKNFPFPGKNGECTSLPPGL
jgi:hypothetical protein